MIFSLGIALFLVMRKNKKGTKLKNISASFLYFIIVTVYFIYNNFKYNLMWVLYYWESTALYVYLKKILVKISLKRNKGDFLQFLKAMNCWELNSNEEIWFKKNNNAQ